MNKKAVEQSIGIGKLITLIVVVIVIVVVIIGLLGLDVYGFIKNLPDFLYGNYNPPDLLEEATIYGTPVKILLNDGENRCIIYETYNIQGKQDSWLKGYGIKGYTLLYKTDSGWKEVDTGMDWVTDEMIELEKVAITAETSDLVEQARIFAQILNPEKKQESSSDVLDRFFNMVDQKIKQDLYVACYLESDDFKDAEILGKKVKLLLKDSEKRCVIYESNEDSSIEYYGVKRNIDYVGAWRLNWLDEAGRWQDKDNGLPNNEEITEINLARDLIKEEKEFGSYVKSFEYKIEPGSTNIKTSIERLTEGDISRFHYLTSATSKITFFKKDSSGNTLESYNPQKLLLAYNKLKESRYNIMIGTVEGSSYSYLWYPRKDNLFVQNGKIYRRVKKTEGSLWWKKEVETFEEIENNLFKITDKEWGVLSRGVMIKQDLKEQC